MRIVFTGGGTGGHILPNIGIIEELVTEVCGKSSANIASRPTSGIHDPLRGKRSIHDASLGSAEYSQNPFPQTSATATSSEEEYSPTSAHCSPLTILYIGTDNPAERELVAREMKRIKNSLTGETFTWQYRAISSGKLRRYFSFQNFTDIARIGAGFFQSLFLLRRFKPDLVFCKGGYVTVPVAAAAAVLRNKIWIHESDVSPGLATRINSRFAEKIFVSFEESKRAFKAAHLGKVEVVGNPLRSLVTQGDAVRARTFTGFHDKRPVLLVMGGSLGSQFINETLGKSLDVLLDKYDIVHVTGAQSKALTKHPHYRAYPFLHNELIDCYALANAIITRSGAGSVFECAAVNKPTLFIPLSKKSSRGDQIENAEAAVKAMHAAVLSEEELEKHPAKLVEVVAKLLSEKKPKNNHGLLVDGAAKIARQIFSVIF